MVAINKEDKEAGLEMKARLLTDFLMLMITLIKLLLLQLVMKKPSLIMKAQNPQSVATLTRWLIVRT